MTSFILTSTPVSLFSITSLFPIISVASRGIPKLPASINAFDKPSLYDGRQKISVLVKIFGILVLYPFVSILFLALSEPGTRVSGFTVPSGIYFDNFIKAWTGGGFNYALLNSFVVVVGVVSVSVISSILAAYAFEKLDIFGTTPLFALLLIGLVLPYESIVISLYYSMKNLELTNTYWSLILPQIGLSIPFSIFWLRASFRSIPKTLSEAAMIEGASRFIILTKILIPQIPKNCFLQSFVKIYFLSPF